MENMQKDSETISLKKIIVDYLYHWKVFLVAACISLVCAILYMVLYPQTYEFVARIKIQEDKNLGSGGSMGLGEAAGLMKSFGLGSISGGAVNIDDEIAIMSSNDLLKKVIIRLGLNVTYKKPYSLISLYEDSPLLIIPDSLTQENLDCFVSFKIEVSKNGAVLIKMKETGKEYSFASLPAQLRVPEGVFDILYGTEGDVTKKIEKPFSLNISVSPAGWMAEDLAEAITVEEFSKNANTLELLYSDYSRKRGKDLLNTLMDEYNNSSESVKKEEGHKAMTFLDVRINGVLQELNGIERTIETYKIKNKLTDIEYDVQFYADAVKNIREKIIEYEAQNHIINLLDTYVKDPKNKYSVIPAMLSADGEKVEERRLKGYLFLGNDLVRYNIGMEMTINGSPAYYALIAAGVNWYEAEKECELILDGTEELEFVVSSMESGKRNRYTMKLDGLPKRPPKTTRIRLRLEYDSPVTCQITAEDLGFGDMFPASHKIWHETMGEV